RNFCPALRLPKSGTAAGSLSGHRSTHCGLSAVYRVRRQPSQDRRAVQAISADRTSRTSRPGSEGTTARSVPKNARLPSAHEVVVGVESSKRTAGYLPFDRFCYLLMGIITCAPAVPASISQGSPWPFNAPSLLDRR